jgi:hypothetical protein
VADDTLPSVALTCETCSSKAELQAVAQSYFSQWNMKTPTGFPGGKFVRPCYWYKWNPSGEPQELWFQNCTVAIVTSKQYPLTGFFELEAVFDGTVMVNAMTASDAATRDMDNRIAARASAMPPVDLPVTHSSDFDATVLPALIQVVNVVTIEGVDWWHGLNPLTWGQFVKLKVANAQTNQRYTVYAGDTITVRFSDGWTLKVELVGPTYGPIWKPVDDSMGDENGRDPNKPYPGTGMAPSGGQTFVYSYGGHTLTFSFPSHIPSQDRELTGMV